MYPDWNVDCIICLITGEKKKVKETETEPETETETETETGDEWKTVGKKDSESTILREFKRKIVYSKIKVVVGKTPFECRENAFRELKFI